MRVLNVMQCTNLGGMEQASLRLMQGLQARGHRCSVVSLNPTGALGPLLAASGIGCVGLQYRGRGGWRSLGDLHARVRAARPDALIMTGHNLLASWILGRIHTGTRLLALHFHHQGVKPLWQWRWIYRVAASRFDCITYPSDFIRGEALDIYPPVEGISRTVRNPITLPALPYNRERTEARRHLAIPADARIVGNAGWLIGRKRFDVFLRTAAALQRMRRDVHFVIAGDGDERSALQALARELGIAERVHWLGWLSDMAPFYASLDVLLFNSDWDALGMTPVEAMSYAVPVAASVVNGGLREIICDDRFGRLIDTHDTGALACAVSALLDEEGRATGLRGRERVASLCDVDTCVAEVEAMLAGASAAAPPTAVSPTRR